MPIVDNSINETIEFPYYHQFDNGVTFDCRIKTFIDPDQGGRLVYIFIDGYEPVVLPVEMFTEIAEFLVTKGLVKGISRQSSVPSPSLNSIPTTKGFSTRKINNTPQPDTSNKESLDPVTSLGGVGDLHRRSSPEKRSEEEYTLKNRPRPSGNPKTLKPKHVPGNEKSKRPSTNIEDNEDNLTDVDDVEDKS